MSARSVGAAPTPLAGSSAIVSGAARGIGRGIAERLLAEGAAVCLTDLDAGALTATERELGATAPGRVCCAAGSVEEPEHWAEATELAASRFGGINILVNNAGLARDAMVHRMSERDWNAINGVILRGAFLGIRAVAPWLRRGDGEPPRRVVNIASVAGLHPSPGNSNYVAAKAGLIALTGSVAREWARFGVTVNAVAPGFIETRMAALRSQEGGPGIPPQIRDALLAKIPLGRPGRPEDVANAVAFFCSPR
ncbi:MAG: SDR family NAD(P)-dependent oxidoreductase, partial [Solirubrobacteraceae bacterium]